MDSLLLFFVSLACSLELPDEQQETSRPGAILKYDLLSNSQSGINYPAEHVGAFAPLVCPWSCFNGVAQYVPEAVAQDPTTNQITITAERDADGLVTSGCLETKKVWSTAQSEDIKTHGYLEIWSTLPIKTNGENFKGSFPAIWLVGREEIWPHGGEIDILLAVNGDPRVEMWLHSSNHSGANAQHPPKNPILMNTDLTEDHLIAGFEWNIQEEIREIDLTWWFTWYDLGSHTWLSENTTMTLQEGGGNDYNDFYETFMSDGFSLTINLGEGGAMPGTSDVLVDGQPQVINIVSAKVFGFPEK